jgi:response regulator NasT
LKRDTAIVQEAACPVIALIDAKNPAYVHEAAKRGVFAYIALDEDTNNHIENDLDIVLRRYAEFHRLQGAFGRRAIIEQAKGILMGRDGIDADTAFQRLKDHSQHTGKKLVDVAEAIVTTHQLLPLHPQGEQATSRQQNV